MSPSPRSRRLIAAGLFLAVSGAVIGATAGTYNGQWLAGLLMLVLALILFRRSRGQAD